MHTGDNLTGKGDGDDESIMVDLPRVSPAVAHIVFVVNSFSGQNFTQIENATARVVDSADRDRELVRYQLSGSGSHTAVVMARLSRQRHRLDLHRHRHPGERPHRRPARPAGAAVALIAAVAPVTASRANPLRSEPLSPCVRCHLVRGLHVAVHRSRRQQGVHHGVLGFTQGQDPGDEQPADHQGRPVQEQGIRQRQHGDVRADRRGGRVHRPSRAGQDRRR